MTLVLIVAAEPAIAVIGGLPEFEPSIPVLRLQALTLVSTFLVATWSLLLLSLHEHRALLITNALAVVVAVIAAVLLIPPLGAEGGALTTIAAETFLAGAYIVAQRRSHPEVSITIGILPKLFLASALGLRDRVLAAARPGRGRDPLDRLLRRAAGDPRGAVRALQRAAVARMIAPMSRLESLRPLAQAASRLALPVGLAEALEAKRTFERRGLGPTSLRTYRQAWLSRLHLLPVDLDLTTGIVVDVGANEGNFSNAVLALAPHAHVIAVEPSPGPRARLEARLGANPNLKIVGSALAAAAGTATLHVTGHDHNSSLHAPRAEMQTLYEDPGWSVVEDIEVPTQSLDDIVGEQDVSALKLDVQGAEMDVLSGGWRTLARTTAVLLEVTFVSHYEDDASFPVLDATMREHGFDLIAMSEPGRNDEGVVTWADACYARRPA